MHQRSERLQSGLQGLLHCCRILLRGWKTWKTCARAGTVLQH